MNSSTSIRNIIGGIILAGLAIWATTIDPSLGWVISIFLCSIITLLITKHFKTRRSSIDRNRRVNDAALMQRYNGSNGIFTFTATGFSVAIETTEQTIAWKQVKTMVAYKIDRFASDDICMDVFCEEQINFTISEKTAGWQKFLDHSKRALPSIATFWEIEMTEPGSKTTITIVYDRQNRAFSEIEKEYYSN